MTCPSQYTENHAACVECIYSDICQEDCSEELKEGSKS